MKNNKTMQRKPGNGMMIKGNVKKSNGCEAINPFGNFKTNEATEGLYVGMPRGGMSRSCKLQTLDNINKHPNAIVIDPKGEIGNFVFDELYKDTTLQEELKDLEGNL